MMAVSNIPNVGRSGIAPGTQEPRPKPEAPGPAERKPAPQPETAKLASGNTARLRVDPQTERIIAEIVNEDNEVVKQVPPEELLELAATSRAIQVLLFDRST
jgi:hypothetical protein